MTQKVLKVGSSAAVTIPKKSLKELGLKIGDEVRVAVNVEEKTVVVESAHKKVSSEVVAWADSFIGRYRGALESLAKK
jgi:putative addiction module antidote